MTKLEEAREYFTIWEIQGNRHSDSARHAAVLLAELDRLASAVPAGPTPKENTVAAPVQPGPRPELKELLDKVMHWGCSCDLLNNCGCGHEQIVTAIEQFFPVAAPSGTMPQVDDLRTAAELLEFMYDKWENGDPSFSESGDSLGNAFQLGDREDEIINVLNRLFPQQKPAAPSSALSPEVEKRLAEIIAEAIRHKQRLTNKYRDNTLVPLILEQIEALRRRLAQQTPEHWPHKAGGLIDAWDMLPNDLSADIGLENLGRLINEMRNEIERGPTPATVTAQPGEQPAKNGCNRHDDCAKANEEWLKRNPGKTFVPFSFHCHSEDCEDCFGQ